MLPEQLATPAARHESLAVTTDAVHGDEPAPAGEVELADHAALGAQPQPARHVFADGFADGFAAADFKIGARLHAGGAQGAFRIAAEEAQARWDTACNEFLKYAQPLIGNDSSVGVGAR